MASPTDFRQVVVRVGVSAHSEALNLRGGFRKMTPDEHPRRHHLADGPLSSLYAPLLSLSSFGAAFVTMCCSARPASSSAPSVLPEDRSGRSIIYIRRLCDHIHVFHIFDQTCIVLTFGWRSATGPPDLWSSSLVPGSTPDATAKPIASSHHVALIGKFKLVWRRLCEALRLSSLAGHNHRRGRLVKSPTSKI